MGRNLLKICLCLILTLSGLQEARATAFQLFAQADSYQQSLVGTWEVVSKVIWSDSPYVEKGLTSSTDLVIERVGDQLHPTWKSPGWVPVGHKVIKFKANKSLHWELSSKYVDDDDYFFVKSVNELQFLSETEGKGTCYHMHSKDGVKTGHYITKVFLRRVSY